MLTSVELPVCVTYEGRHWYLYTYEYPTPDGRFTGYLYALSFEHAAELLCDLKERAEITGVMVGVIDGPDLTR